MDIHALSGSSFFRKSSSCPASEEAVISRELVQAAQVIKQWWKKTNLRQTAKESSLYYDNILSLKSKSFSDLEAFVLDKNSLATTRKLLMHLEQAKDLILHERERGTDFPRSERVFLAAYLIVTKSKHVFETPADIDELLVTHADEMLTAFENLCRFMGETYMDKIPDEPHSPMSRKTPSSDQIFKNMQRYELSQSQENMEKDHCFMTEGRAYLEAFHNKQMAYYEAFSKWEINSRLKVAQIYIGQYLYLEIESFEALSSHDPRAIELYEGFGYMQEAIREKIEDLLGQEGLDMLNQDLDVLRKELEARQWVAAPDEALLHELAVNPEFTSTPESCMIYPQKDINAAISAVTQREPDLNPILDVFEDIRDQFVMFIPHNIKRITELQTDYSRQVLAEQIALMGLEKGLYRIIYAFIERIKLSESREHVPETVAFQNALDNMEGLALVLNQAFEFIYYKFSQINLEIANFHINQARSLVADNIVKFEQNKFKQHMANDPSDHQYKLANILQWIGAIVKTPDNFRLDTRLLYSEYIATYMTHAICIGMLQKPGKFDLQAVPETFYLDRVRLAELHGKYQRIFYTTTALVVFQKFGGKLSGKELTDQKDRLLTFLETEKIIDPEEAASLLATMLNMWLKDKGISISKPDTEVSAQLLKNSCAGINPIAKLTNKYLGDQLWSYFQKGHLPAASSGQMAVYGVQTDLGKLGSEILPLLRLHVKVHGEFYNTNVNGRLWKPLFTLLKSSGKLTEFPPLFVAEQNSIRKARADMQKLTFLLSGLALIQQALIFADKWSPTLGLQMSTMKELACKFDLLDPRATKDVLEERLLALMTDVTRKQRNLFQLVNQQENQFGDNVEDDDPFEFDETSAQHMSDWLHLAKLGKTLGYHAFLEEIGAIFRQYIAKGSMPELNPRLLTSEFKEEIERICEQIKDITIAIKQSQMPEDIDPIAQVIPAMRSGFNV